jgi:hypothetical protein
MRRHLQCVQPDNLHKLLLKRNNTVSHQCQGWGSHHTSWMDDVTAITLQPWFSTFRFPPLLSLERFYPQKEVWVQRWCGQHCQKLVVSTRWMVLVRHIHHSMLTQSYGTEWRVFRKLGYKPRFCQHYVFFMILECILVRKNVWHYFWPSLVHRTPQGSFPGDYVFWYFSCFCCHCQQ